MLRLLPLAALAVLVTACGAQDHERVGGVAAAASRSISVDGVALDLPSGWDGYAKWLDRDESSGEIWAASRRFVESTPRPPFPHETLAALGDDGIAVEIAIGLPPPGSASWPLRTDVSLADGYFLSDGYEGQPAPGVSTQIIRARIANRALWVQVFFGRPHPDDAMRASANRVLGSLFAVREAREGGFVSFEDPAVGISGRYPEGWHRARALTELGDPREVLTLATYPLRGGAEAGECAPDARADMPRDGTFVWLLEYSSRPDLLRERFPPRPEHFDIGSGLVPASEHLECFSSPGYRAFFRAAGRFFDVLVAFGGEPTDAQVAVVERILDSLRFQPQPVPPPDPYAGWPSVNDNPGDSFRPPPNWPATAAMFPLDTPRPRSLLFASNRSLAGLPAELVPYVHQLPSPFPELSAFPAAGVLVWVVEDEKGEASTGGPSGSLLARRRAPRISSLRSRPALHLPSRAARATAATTAPASSPATLRVCSRASCASAARSSRRPRTAEACAYASPRPRPPPGPSSATPLRWPAAA